MISRQRSLLLAAVITVIIFGIGFLFLHSEKPTAGFIAGQSDAISKSPDSGHTVTIAIDFSRCSRGGDTVYLSLGSTHFAFEGIQDDICRFHLGTEIENPMWDGRLTWTCDVPVSTGSQSFAVGDMGISFGDFWSEYCRKN